MITPDSPNTFRTLTEVWENSLRLGMNKPFLGYRPIISREPLKYADHYVWETYAEVEARRRNLGSALSALFQKGELGGVRGEMNTVGIWSQNRPGMLVLEFHTSLYNVHVRCVEWQIIDLTLQGYNLVGVSLYDTLGRDSVGKLVASSSSLTC